MAQPWTTKRYDDIAELQRLAAEGKTAAEIAQEMTRATGRERTFDAVRLKAGREGVEITPLRYGEGKAAEQPDPVPFGRPEAKEEITRTDQGDSISLRVTSARLKTTEAVLEHCGIDPDVWQVDSQEVKYYEGYMKDGDGKPILVPMCSITAKLKRSQTAHSLKMFADRLAERARMVAPVYPKRGPVLLTGARHMLEVCAMDLHVGKLAWAPETGEDYDSAIAEDVFTAALEDLLAKTKGYPVERIVMPIGNDLLQIDSAANQTTAGTPQDTDSRYAKIVERVESMMIHALDRLSEVAPVEGVIVPGNHDEQTALLLGRILAAWYRHSDRVDIDVSPKLRKYMRYGVNLIGYTHGRDEKPADLPLIMAQECPEDWSQTWHREWHCGHRHKSKETRYTAGDSFNGVRVRILPSLCSADAWHHRSGYVGEIRAAEAYLWNPDAGYAGHLSSAVAPKRFRTARAA